MKISTPLTSEKEVSSQRQHHGQWREQQRSSHRMVDVTHEADARDAAAVHLAKRHCRYSEDQRQ